MIRKQLYETPEMEVVRIKMGGVIAASTLDTKESDMNMNTLSAQDEDWGSWS